jgi:chromosome segregation ATPase
MPDELAEMRDRQDGFDERQDKFDARLTTLEETIKTEATVRAAMDSDISDIKIEQRAQRGLLQAVAVTQSEHGADIRVIKEDVRDIKGRLGNVEQRLGNVEGRLGSVEGRLGNVEGRLGTVESTLGNVQVGVQTIIAMLDRHIADHEGS